MQFFAMFVNMGGYSCPQEGFGYLKKMYGRFMEELSLNGEQIELVCSAEEIRALRGEGKISAVLCVEEGGVIGESLELLDELYDMGVRLITLTWNYENSIGFPNSKSWAMNRGLKSFGKKVVQRMEELGMFIDVSHLSDGGFWDVAEICKKPFIASHSNARALCGHPRNLTDEMLMAIAEAGGVTGLNFYGPFLGDDGTGSIEQIVAHTRHIYNVAGIEVLALGSDFDGFSTPGELTDCGKLPLLAEAYRKEGFTEREIEMICRKNAVRVVEELI